jgi:GPH family glycoside/pentoside/hexuronide:cation symporter
VLLGARLFDAFIDPLIGRATDRLFAPARPCACWAGGGAALVLARLCAAVFSAVQGTRPRCWCLGTAMLVLTYAAYSALSVAHQSWGAMLGGDEALRSRIVSWREGLGWWACCWRRAAFGGRAWAVTAVFCVLRWLIGWLAWRARAPVAAARGRAPTRSCHLWLPCDAPAFRRLLGVFMLNGIASAVPATLVLFFIQDRLQAASWSRLFPGQLLPVRGAEHPAVAAQLVARFGLARCWLAGMVLAMWPLSGPRCWARATLRPSWWCARCPAWRWAPTWRCPARCWPA